MALFTEYTSSSQKDSSFTTVSWLISQGSSLACSLATNDLLAGRIVAEVPFFKAHTH